MIKIERDGDYAISPLSLPAERISRLESCLMLFFTGIQRHASEIAKVQIENTKQNEKELEVIERFVPLAVSLLKEDRLDDFGRLLHDGWTIKRRLSDKISSPKLDSLYDRALDAGALGGKVLGAGGGGFMLFYVPLERQSDVRKALDGLFNVLVRFENAGSQVVLNAQ